MNKKILAAIVGVLSLSRLLKNSADVCKRGVMPISTMCPWSSKAMAEAGQLRHQHAAAISFGSRTRL